MRLQLPLVLLSIICNLVRSQIENPTVSTSYGKIEGKVVEVESNGKLVDTYLGIPFAKPPIGELRFKHPIAPDSWMGTLNATQHSKTCPQVEFNPALKSVKSLSSFFAFTGQDEDCLYLNVWVPKPNPKNAEVIVFLYGGGFSIGSTAIDLYDPSTFVAEENVIVVDFNYRIGAMGFFCYDHPEFHKNNGLFDQLRAFQWVKDNIGAFGGDPNKVTLRGLSAGSISIGLHLLSPLSNGLFQRVIMESGFPTGWGTKRKSHMESLSFQLIESMCPDPSDKESVAQCLMTEDVKTIISNEPRIDYQLLAFFPVVDGELLIEEPEVTLEKQTFQKVDVLGGVTLNEGALVAILFEPFVFNLFAQKLQLDEQDRRAMINNVLPYASGEVKKAVEIQYTDSSETSDSILNQVDHLIGDLVFTCPGNRFSRAYAQAKQNVYGYYFTHRSVATHWAKWVGTPHGEELLYANGSPLANGSTYTEDDKILSKRLMRYWANFARTGNPNLSPNEQDDRTLGIEWPKFSPNDEIRLILEPNSNSTITNLRGKECRFWDYLVPYLQQLSDERATKIS